MLRIKNSSKELREFSLKQIIQLLKRIMKHLNLKKFLYIMDFVLVV